MLPAQGDSGERAARVIIDHLIDVPDFPQPGILFRDLSPLFADGEAFREIVDVIATQYAGEFDLVAGVEARGFLLSAALAYATGTGMTLIRKSGKLPRRTHAASYDLEYGAATLEVHADAFVAGQRVLLVDDVLATGGTAAASYSLIERAGGTVTGFAVLVELASLHGRRHLSPHPVHAMATI